MRSALHEGMVAYTSDGERLGRIVQLHPGHFVLEKGVFFPLEFSCRYEDVRSIQGDELWLDFTRSHVTQVVEADTPPVDHEPPDMSADQPGEPHA